RLNGSGAGRCSPASRPVYGTESRNFGDTGGRWIVWVRVLGSAAGGGFPQWNCTCPQCGGGREGSRPARRRTQSSLAVSPDYRQWFLFNASPDVHTQIESLRPSRGARVTVLLTDAELDHTLGLLLLREGGGVELHATEAVHDTLYHGTSLLRTLEAYCPVD